MVRVCAFVAAGAVVGLGKVSASANHRVGGDGLPPMLLTEAERQELRTAGPLRVSARRLATGIAVHNGAGLNAGERQLLLDEHNRYRSLVASGGSDQPAAANMNQLFWDDALATLAQSYAEECYWGHNLDNADDLLEILEEVDSTFVFDDSDGGAVGENLYVYPVSGDESRLNFTITRGLEVWYTESNAYDFETRDCDSSLLSSGQSSCGHYTQLVWADTRFVGCGAAMCPSLDNSNAAGYEDSLYIACNYYTAGNWVGEDPYVPGDACSECGADITCDDSLCVNNGDYATANNANVATLLFAPLALGLAALSVS